MYSKEELAQPVGNAKIRGEFDTDPATATGPNTNDAVLFRRNLFFSLTSQSLAKPCWLLPNDCCAVLIRRPSFNSSTLMTAMFVISLLWRLLN